MFSDNFAGVSGDYGMYFVSKGQALLVGGDVDVVGKEEGCFGVLAHFVAEVGEQCLSWVDAFDQCECFVQRDVRHVRCVAQCVDYEGVCAA